MDGKSKEELVRVPLHRRRFDARHRDLPTELKSLPAAKKLESGRSFCEELVDRIQKKDTNEELQPLFNRTAHTAMSALATEDAFDHLDKLYRLMDQIFALKEQNTKVQRRARDLEHIRKLKEMHSQIENEIMRIRTTDPEAFFQNEATSMDLGEEYECAEALLGRVLAAGRNASLKRAKWKNPPRSKLRVRSQRSRSMGGEELEACPFESDGYLAVPYASRRASDSKQCGEKAKISKWTRVKAAFKWERAHTGISSEPVQKVTAPNTPTYPSIAQITPASLSPASSSEDIKESCEHDLARRSRSFDGASILDPLQAQQEETSNTGAKMHKTPWGKMKNIIQTRKDSVRKKQNRDSVRSCSGGRTSEYYTSDCGNLSQSESTDVVTGTRTPQRKTSSQEKSDLFAQEPLDIKRTTPTLTVTMPSSEELTNKQRGMPPLLVKHSPKSGLKKQKSLDMSKRIRSSGLQDSSDPETSSPLPRRHDSKWKKVKKAFLTTPASTPSSPSRHSAFFSYEPEDIANANRSKYGFDDQKDNKALHIRMSKTFGTSVASMDASSSSPSGSPSQIGKAGYDWDKNVSPKAKEKLKRTDVPTTPNDDKMPSIKVNNMNNLAFVPTHDQLSEDFRKKLDEWKKLKATNSVPTYTGDEFKDHDEKTSKMKKTVAPQKKEILVQTGAGCFRFEGISRSFTRKLHEWEKSRGIAPEVSTTALLKESLAKPPLPNTRVIAHGPLPTNFQKGERGPIRLQRSQSAGSVRDDSAPHISTSASSLSLTNIGDDVSENQVSDFGEECYDTYIETGDKPLGTESDSDGGPGAMLVEIEDEIEETAAPLMACSPQVNPQTPIYRYGQAQERHRACENTEGKVSSFAQTCNLPDSFLDKLPALETGVNQLIQEENIINKLLTGKKNVKMRCDDVSKKIDIVKKGTQSSSELNNLERRLGRLVKEEEILQNSLHERSQNFNTIFEKFFVEIKQAKVIISDSNIPSPNKANELIEKVECCSNLNKERTDNIDSEDMCNILNELDSILQCITQMQNECEKSNKKENSLCIAYVVTNFNPANVNSKSETKLTIDPITDGKKSQQKDISSNAEATTTIKDTLSDDSKGAKKKSTELTGKSSMSKRKTKSRQRLEREKSIHTDSDSEDDVNTITVEFPKRKKNLKPKTNEIRHSTSNTSIQNTEKQLNTDSSDNVFVLKLKPTLSNEQLCNENESPKMSRYTKRTVLMKKSSFDNGFIPKHESEHNESMEILIPNQLSISLPPETIQLQTVDSEMKPDVFVKTTRKIFSPIRRDSSGETKAVIGFDLEEIANSIKNRNDGSEERKTSDRMPDIIVNSENKGSCSEISSDNSRIPNRLDYSHKQNPIYGSDSLNSIRSQTPSPLFLKKQFNSNNFKSIAIVRNESEESLYQSKDVLPIRRGSGERFPMACKGSPILSRASTPGISSNSLPPLPASPPSNRRDKPTKETAPSIRIMIQKYNMRLNEEGEIKQQSGSNTPPWRSPRAQERFPHDSRRTLLQSARNNPFIEREVQKSASTSHIMKNQTQNNFGNKFTSHSGENIGTISPMTPPLPKKLLRGILKSSSAGSLKTPVTPQKNENIPIIPNLEKVSLSADKPKEKINCGPEMLENKTLENINSLNMKPEIPHNIPKKENTSQINMSIHKKIDVNLLRLAKSSTIIPIQTTSFENHYASLESSSRALKLKRAKEQFLASGTNSVENNSDKAFRKDRNTSSNVDLAENRLSQISFNSDTSYEANSLASGIKPMNDNHDNSLLIKSASVGMINVDRDAYEKLNKDERGSKMGSKFGLSNLASKFRKVKIRTKSKQTDKKEEKEKLDTVSKLCRQSLLVNLHGDTEIEKEKRRQSDTVQTQTDKSIVLAGKTGGAIALSNEEVFALIEKENKS